MITENKFTEGPWKVQADPLLAGKHPYHDRRFITTADCDLADTNHSAGVIICKLTDSEHQTGNANLIAAAPDLLFALEEILAECTPSGYRLDLALAAIAKATKGQP